ncbi:MAG TPA: LLM class F420-dependent oxidoreductase [Actinomycetota bacterium]|jgi:probable F420-dependent oxidoreductase|nr:LLM class F420-dependent oxidoreductase [Actinomycetota bacterium]
MRVGLAVATSNPWATPDFLASVAAAAEERGFDSLWVPEHVVLFDEYASQYPYSADGRVPAGGEVGVLEPLNTLAFLAARTTTIRLGTGICLVPQRNPVYTAKEAATVDWLSGGRLDLGIGIGWLAEEFAAVDVPFARRADRCREYVEVMRRLWCDPVSEFEGEFYSLPACRQYPKPVQQPHPPVHFGGESDAALRRVADIGQGWYGFNVSPDDLPERLKTLGGFLADRGRSLDEITVSICPYLLGLDAEKAKRYEDIGVDRLIVVAIGRDADRVIGRLDELSGVVL